MPETLTEFLKQQAERRLRDLLDEVDAVDAAEARRDHRPDWPDQTWGIGQDGSIAGIVYHVAAWKQLTLPLLHPGGKAGGRNTFDPAAAPDPEDWQAVRDWLRQIGAEWNMVLRALPDAEFDALREWEGTTLSVLKYVEEMIRHDIQHAAQIEYLRQCHRAGSRP